MTSYKLADFSEDLTLPRLEARGILASSGLPSLKPSLSLNPVQIPLEPNTVYVLPPRKNLSIGNQCLQLLEQVAEKIHYPINGFFHSLAQKQEEKAIGILLSGTGNDGTEGLQAISQAGGIALVQSPETAQFTSMPSSAIPFGCVDEILSPKDLANAVYNLVRYSLNYPISQSEEGELIPVEKFETILDILAKQEQIDFSHYKISTISRRIIHRCAITQSRTLEDYISYLVNSPDEVKLLRQDLLIGATRFFRDAPAWEIIRQQILPKIIENLPDEQPIRIWIPACATGEEAYTMAILVDEAINESKKEVGVKIFATDLDNNSLEVVSHGVYAESIASDISPQRLEKYFTRLGSTFQVKRHLREMLIISPHDLTKNAGFSKMNLISCRNVLIYMQPQLQQQVLRLLHFSLAPQGTLFLGNAETLGSLEGEFLTIESKWKIYQKRREIQLSLMPLTRQTVFTPITVTSRSKSNTTQFDRLIGSVFNFCFQDRKMTCLLVNRDNQLMHVFYNGAKLLEFPIGQAKLNVVELVSSSLQLPLKTALHRAKRDQATVMYSNIQMARGLEIQTVKLRVGCDSKNPLMQDLFIVLFELEAPVSEPTKVLNFSLDKETNQQLKELEYELQQTRENLQATIEELETTNEEQQATNEELLASNEELQSTNEELQSVNEELYTVNAEYQIKIQQLTELSNDIDNLLRSTNIGVIFLDNNLNIRKFTPAATEVINIRSTDINRPLTHFTHNLNCPNLVEILVSFIQEETPIEQEVINVKTQEQLLMRVNVYSREDGTHDGMVVTFININELKQIQKQLEKTNLLLENIYANSPVGLCVLNDQLEFIKLNETLAEINGISIEEHLGKTVAETLPDLNQQVTEIFDQVMNGEVIRDIQIQGTTSAFPNKERYWLGSYYPVDLLEGNRGMGGVITEITQLKETKQNLQKSKARLEYLLKYSPAVIFCCEPDEDYAATFMSENVKDILGYDAQRFLEDPSFWINHVHPDDRERILSNLPQIFEQEFYGHEYRFLHSDGSYHWFYAKLRLVRDETGNPAECVGYWVDITELIAVEEALRNNETFFRAVLDNSDLVVFSQDINLRYTWVYNPLPGYTIEEMLGKQDQDLFSPQESVELLLQKQLVIDNGEIQRHEFTLYSSQGIKHYEMTYQPLLNNQQEIIGLTGVAIDITERKEMEKALANSQILLEEAQKIAHLGSWEFWIETQQMNWSDEVYNILGIDNKESPNLDRLINLIVPEERNNLIEHLDTLKNEGITFDLDLKLSRSKDDVIRYINIIGKANFNEEKQINQIYGTILDISDHKQAELALHQRAFYDPLTGLPNRSLFLDRLEYTLNRAIDYQKNAAQRTSSSDVNHFALLYLDLDEFKEVNDTQGHLVGDQLLLEVAKRLTECLRPGDTICRLGGDEFAIILENIINESLAISTAQKIHESLSIPFYLNDTLLNIKTSIGIAIYQAELYQNKPLTLLLDNADIAMYKAKSNGPGQTVVFTPEMRLETEDKVQLKYELQRAIEQEEFILYYQPIVELNGNELKGFEILVRWNHPQRGIISPGHFLPFMQDSGMLPSLEKWIISQACYQCQQWIEQFDLVNTLIFSVNISPQFLEDAHFVSWLDSLLQEVSLSPQQLMLEVTETALIENSLLTQNSLSQLKNMGIRIALDDFGTGFSSLSHLHRFPLDIIKIDRSFINEVTKNTASANIVEGILYLSQKLNLTTTAEGIETPEQKDFLQNTGCQYAQGYLFSPPLSSDDVISWLQ